jgi:hypothetical protein
LPDYQLRFNLPGMAGFEPSAAAVEPCQGKQVQGVLYTLTAEDFARVGITEGIPFAYRWQRCHVYPYNGDGNEAGQQVVLASSGGSEVAYTLVATQSFLKDIPPSKSYLGLLIQGAKTWKMDRAYVQELEGTKPAHNLLIPQGLAGASLQWAQWRQRWAGNISQNQQ